MADRITYPDKTTGDVFYAAEATEIKTKVNSHADDIEGVSLSTFSPSMTYNSAGYYSDYTLTVNITITASSISNGLLRAVKITTAGTHTVSFGAGIETDALIGITNGQALDAGTYWFYFISIDGSVHVSVPSLIQSSGSSYTFANTQHMIIDAVSEGMRIDADNLLPSDGSGTDSVMSWELWYKTPSTMGVGRVLLRMEDSSEQQMQIGYNSANLLYFQLADGTDPTNITIRAAESPSSGINLVADTLYHIVCTYDGSATYAGLEIYIDSLIRQDPADTSAGSYVGLTGDKSGVQTFIPRSDAAQGEGEYQVVRAYNVELSQIEVNSLKALFDANIGLPSELQAKCIQENLFEANLTANIGTNGTAIGSPTYGSN